MSCLISKLKMNIQEETQEIIEEMKWNEFPLINFIVKEHLEGFIRMLKPINFDTPREQGFKGCGGGP